MFCIGTQQVVLNTPEMNPSGSYTICVLLQKLTNLPCFLSIQFLKTKGELPYKLLRVVSFVAVSF